MSSGTVCVLVTLATNFANWLLFYDDMSWGIKTLQGLKELRDSYAFTKANIFLPVDQRNFVCFGPIKSSCKSDQ